MRGTLGLYGVRRMFWNWEHMKCPTVHPDMVHFMFCAFHFNLRKCVVSTPHPWRPGQGLPDPQSPQRTPTPGWLTLLPPGAHSLPSHPVPSRSCPNPPGTRATSTTGVLPIAAQRPSCSHHGELTLPVGPPAWPSQRALGSVREVPQPPGPWGLRLQGQPQAWGGASARHLRTSWHQSACPHARLVTQTGSCSGRNLGQEGVPLS